MLIDSLFKFTYPNFEYILKQYSVYESEREKKLNQLFFSDNKIYFKTIINQLIACDKSLLEKLFTTRAKKIDLVKHVKDNVDNIKIYMLHKNLTDYKKILNNVLNNYEFSTHISLKKLLLNLWLPIRRKCIYYCLLHNYYPRDILNLEKQILQCIFVK